MGQSVYLFLLRLLCRLNLTILWVLIGLYCCVVDHHSAMLTPRHVHLNVFLLCPCLLNRLMTVAYVHSKEYIQYIKIYNVMLGSNFECSATYAGMDYSKLNHRVSVFSGVGTMWCDSMRFLYDLLRFYFVCSWYAQVFGHDHIDKDMIVHTKLMIVHRFDKMITILVPVLFFHRKGKDTSLWVWMNKLRTDEVCCGRIRFSHEVVNDN